MPDEQLRHSPADHCKYRQAAAMDTAKSTCRIHYTPAYGWSLEHVLRCCHDYILDSALCRLSLTW